MANREISRRMSGRGGEARVAYDGGKGGREAAGGREAKWERERERERED
jgi:hypothetical protein